MLCNVGSQHAADTDAETDATLRAAKASASRSLPELAARFNGKGRWRERLPTILDALVALGRARTQGADRWIDAPQR